MARIEGFKVKNYRALKDVTIGRLLNQGKSEALKPLTAVIGMNGVGKSSLFDAFGFLSDCLRLGVEEACDTRGRGGYERIHSQGQAGPIEFELYYRERPSEQPITYVLAIDRDAEGRPYVKKERLRQRRTRQKKGQPFSFLILDDGTGAVWQGSSIGIKETEDGSKGGESEETNAKEDIELDDRRYLGIATLGLLKQHPRISAFRRFIEGWYLSYFTPDAARSLPMAGPQKHLNTHGDNLGNVVQYMEREHSQKFEKILKRIAEKIPGITSIKTKKTDDGRLLLQFNDRGFEDPFYAQQMSDGTLKLFSYLLLLEDPTPPPLICIEEPENGLYHKLLAVLAKEFREQTAKSQTQIFVTTHQPYFVDALDPEEVWILDKDTTGFSQIRRASDDALVKSLVYEGAPLGGLWYSDYLEKR